MLQQQCNFGFVDSDPLISSYSRRQIVENMNKIIETLEAAPDDGKYYFDFPGAKRWNHLNKTAFEKKLDI